MAGTQGDEWIGLHHQAGPNAESIVAMEQDRHDHQFLQSKLASNAVSRAGAERKINQRLGWRTPLRRKPGWIEFLRFRPESVAPMEMKNRDDHIHPLRDTIAAQLILRRTTAPDRPNRGIQT